MNTARIPPTGTAAIATDEAPRTLDLAALAGVPPGAEIRVRGMTNRTLELFERTQDLVENTGAAREAGAPPPDPRFVPQHADLRARFKFAEVLGSYATLNTLVDQYAPAYALSRAVAGSSRVAELSVREVTMLGDYRDQIRIALEHASAHLALTSVSNFSDAELQELNDILNEARDRYQSLETILGMRLIHDVEQAVERLHQLCLKIGLVQRSISGIFLVDSEIMFVPSAELVRIVDDIFKAIGNPFVVENIDGTILLAARNLLIQAMSFYAYYGREQIYHVFGNDHGKAGRGKVAAYIRQEIKSLFGACKADNKLVLTRVMDSAEREFEISVEAIQIEAANRAIAEVDRLIPEKPVLPKRAPRGLLARMRNWLFRQAA